MCKYWSEAGPAEFGPLVVELLETKEYTGVIGNSFSLRNKNAKVNLKPTLVYKLLVLYFVTKIMRVRHGKYSSDEIVAIIDSI